MGQGDAIGGRFHHDAVDAVDLAFAFHLDMKGAGRSILGKCPVVVMRVGGDNVVRQFGCRAAGLVEFMGVVGLGL